MKIRQGKECVRGGNLENQESETEDDHRETKAAPDQQTTANRLIRTMIGCFQLELRDAHTKKQLRRNS